MNDKREGECGEEEELVAEGVGVLVVAPPDDRVSAHAPDDGGGGGDEDELHGRVVEGDEVGEQVQVPRHEHHRVHLLRLQRDP